MSTTPFQYFVSSKGSFVVVSLIGPMNSKAVPLLEDLIAELAQYKTSSVFIFNVRDASEISGDAVQSLAQLQKDVRDRPAELRLCGIKPEVKAKLLTQGVIRTAETFDNLQLAILAPPKMALKKTAT